MQAEKNMAKMILPSRDRASVSQSISAGSIQELLFGPSLIIDEDCKLSVDACRNTLHIYLKSTSVSGRCPCCGAVSSAVNCAAFRHPQWMPVNGMTSDVVFDIYVSLALIRIAGKLINSEYIPRAVIRSPKRFKNR